MQIPNIETTLIFQNHGQTITKGVPKKAAWPLPKGYQKCGWTFAKGVQKMRPELWPRGNIFFQKSGQTFTKGVLKKRPDLCQRGTKNATWPLPKGYQKMRPDLCQRGTKNAAWPLPKGNIFFKKAVGPLTKLFFKKRSDSVLALTKGVWQGSFSFGKGEARLDYVKWSKYSQLETGNQSSCNVESLPNNANCTRTRWLRKAAARHVSKSGWVGAQFLWPED
jgi:hypothetical protein